MEVIFYPPPFVFPNLAQNFPFFIRIRNWKAILVGAAIVVGAALIGTGIGAAVGSTILELAEVSILSKVN